MQQKMKALRKKNIRTKLLSKIKTRRNNSIAQRQQVNRSSRTLMNQQKTSIVDTLPNTYQQKLNEWYSMHNEHIHAQNDDNISQNATKLTFSESNKMSQFRQNQMMKPRGLNNIPVVVDSKINTKTPQPSQIFNRMTNDRVIQTYSMQNSGGAAAANQDKLKLILEKLDKLTKKVDKFEHKIKEMDQSVEMLQDEFKNDDVNLLTTNVKLVCDDVKTKFKAVEKLNEKLVDSNFKTQKWKETFSNLVKSQMQEFFNFAHHMYGVVVVDKLYGYDEYDEHDSVDYIEEDHKKILFEKNDKLFLIPPMKKIKDEIWIKCKHTDENRGEVVFLWILLKKGSTMYVKNFSDY